MNSNEDFWSCCLIFYWDPGNPPSFCKRVSSSSRSLSSSSRRSLSSSNRRRSSWWQLGSWVENLAWFPSMNINPSTPHKPFLELRAVKCWSVDKSMSIHVNSAIIHVIRLCIDSVSSHLRLCLSKPYFGWITLPAFSMEPWKLTFPTGIPTNQPLLRVTWDLRALAD